LRATTPVPHHRIALLANRHRARELRDFRALVVDYFARAERDPDGVPFDWEGAQAARSQIHRMLPRVVQVVRAAVPDQEVLDVRDMALGVYEGDRLAALVRSASPFHYAGVLLRYLGRLPRRMLATLGLGAGS